MRRGGGRGGAVVEGDDFVEEGRAAAGLWIAHTIPPLNHAPRRGARRDLSVTRKSFVAEARAAAGASGINRHKDHEHTPRCRPGWEVYRSVKGRSAAAGGAAELETMHE